MEENNKQLAAQKARAMHLAQNNQLKEAKELCAAICGVDPDDAQIWNLLSSINGVLGDIEEAGDCSRRAIELRPDCSEARINLGNVLLHQGRYEEALAQYRKVLQLEPGNLGAQNNAAQVLVKMGKHDEAEACYREITRLNPTAVDVWYNIGNLQIKQKKYADAARTFRQALSLDPNHLRVVDIKRYGPELIQSGCSEGVRELVSDFCTLRPSDPEAWFLLSTFEGLEGDMTKAAESARQAIALKQDHISAHMNLAKALVSLGRHEEAVTHYQTVLQYQPGVAAVHGELGNAFAGIGKFHEAEACYTKALRLDPKQAEIRCGLGNVKYRQKEYDDAVLQYREAIRLKPDYALAYSSLGFTQYAQNNIKSAIANLRHAIELDPGLAAAYNKLAVVFRGINHLEAAEALARQAVDLNPDSAAAHYTMANIHHAYGRIREAIEENRRVLELNPSDFVAHSAQLMCMEHLPEYSPGDLLKASQEWAARHAPKGVSLPTFSNVPDPRRKLRIGYVSADLRHHPVGYFMEQVLAHHDRSKYETFCYFNYATADEVTGQLRASADHWRSIVEQPDEAVARQINEDQIDILVDLAGHSAENRLLIFAHKPAPVQATWLGYFDTTGLETVDYIIADRHVIPPKDERFYVERVARLPSCYMIFSPPRLPLEVSPLPASAGGKVTFGCFNNPAKVTEEMVDVWARLLRAVPDARLYMKYKPFDDEGVSRRYLNLFTARGVEPERIRLSGHSPREKLLEAYQEVDLALDSFPYTGGITTLEALWMGVPVISMRGDRYVSRVAASILETAGLGEFVVDTPQAYIDKAVAAVSDLERLAKLRAGLREQMVRALCDGAGFTLALEGLYRTMWETWCETRPDLHRG